METNELLTWSVIVIHEIAPLKNLFPTVYKKERNVQGPVGIVLICMRDLAGLLSGVLLFFVHSFVYFSVLGKNKVLYSVLFFFASQYCYFYFPFSFWM